VKIAMYQGMLAETVNIQGHNGDEIETYFARPLGAGPYPGVVVIHHGPGWDEWSKEITRKLAYHGYVAICPNLNYREAPGSSSDDAAAAARAAGGVPDARCIGDVEGATRYLRSLPYSNGKVGVIGHCSGGRQVYLVACNIPSLNAAVDCYGGGVVVTPDQLTPRRPVAVFDMTPNLACPLLGLFGADDANPGPPQVALIEAELKRHGKTYEFHTYEGAGHAFFSDDRPSYRQAAAVDGWQKVFAWYEKYLSA
jgi:carboxymethylenebutenolidase